MRIHPLLLIACLATPAAAQAPKPAAPTPPAHPPAANAPKKLGVFGDWTAATHQEAGATVCYAFTYAAHSVPTLPGRDEVVLTVAERPNARDDVALNAGFPFAPGAAVTVQVDQTGLDFYTAQPQPGRNAFARDEIGCLSRALRIASSSIPGLRSSGRRRQVLSRWTARAAI